VVKAVDADVFVGLETELWPNLLHHVKRSGARTILVNGRISDRSFPAYRRMRLLFGWTLRQFDRLMAQTSRDASRLEAIGADASDVTISGNSKFDQETERLAPAQADALRRELRLPLDIPVLVVGSTRNAAEERKVIAAYAEARRELPDLGLVHAPRHVDRADEVIAAMRDAGFAPVRRSEIGDAEGPFTQIVLDTFGELARVYALADAAFIGNSLVPPGGGQNMLQPLAQGKAAVYGPYMSDFRDLCALAEEAGVGFPVGQEAELAARVVSLVRDERLRASVAQRASALIEANRGAAARYAEAIGELAAGRQHAAA
jgi:3-deoxy-D-manno-octulosonic-acid transferase